MLNLSGRVALVTGAGSGIGAATVQLLGEHGAVVFGADLTAPDDADGRECLPLPGSSASLLHLDVREEAHWERAVATILEGHGKLDAVVHAAGVSAASPVAETTLVEWRRVMETNLDGSFLAIKHGIRAMRPDGGSIVVVGSASGIRPAAGAAAYSTSKAALTMLVRTSAKECREADLNIRINVLSPAGVKTPMWRTMPFFQELVRQHGSEDGAFAALEAGSGGRFAEPEQIAQSILFLVSDAATHITGVELPVDGGYIL